jgi:hypothetical protein
LSSIISLPSNIFAIKKRVVLKECLLHTPYSCNNLHAVFLFNSHTTQFIDSITNVLGVLEVMSSGHYPFVSFWKSESFVQSQE